MIEVVCYSNGKVAGSAEACPADDPESALLAARTLWDEAFNGWMGQERSIIFTVDGEHVRTVTKRP